MLPPPLPSSRRSCSVPPEHVRMFHVKHPAWKTLADLANQPNARANVCAIRAYIPTVGILIRATPIGKTRTRQIAHWLASACLRFTRSRHPSARDIHDIMERQRTKRPGACRPRSATRQPPAPPAPSALRPPRPPRPRRTLPFPQPRSPIPSALRPLRLLRILRAFPAPTPQPLRPRRSRFPLRNPNRHPRPPQPEPATHPRSCCGNSVIIRALSHSRS